jgi:sigma-B regulation protein RsbQ
MNTLERNKVKILGGNGPVLLYAHGFGCNQTMWNRITPAFEGTHRQVLFDYSGCGPSTGAAFDASKYASLSGYAQDVLDVCDALALSRGVTFVGHSVSSTIGMLASIARPELFERLVLIGPTPCFLNHPPEYTGGFERADLEGLLSLMDQNYLGWANYLAPVVAGAANAPDVADALLGSFCSTDPVTMRVFAQATFFADNRADVPRVTAPTLILQHRHDDLAPISVGNYLHAHLQNSTLEVLDIAGHSGHMSHPDLIIKSMQNYFNASEQP